MYTIYIIKQEKYILWLQESEFYVNDQYIRYAL